MINVVVWQTRCSINARMAHWGVGVEINATFLLIPKSKFEKTTGFLSNPVCKFFFGLLKSAQKGREDFESSLDIFGKRKGRL